MNTSKIIIINTILFFVVWTGIMLIGSDFPPPVGFIWVVILIAVLDYIQYKYLQGFIIELISDKKKSFIHNLIFFLIGGVVISSLFLIVRFNLYIEEGFVNWVLFIFAVTAVSAIYGIFLWVFNYILTRYISNK